jgi:hypothetical protein
MFLPFAPDDPTVLSGAALASAMPWPLPGFLELRFWDAAKHRKGPGKE